jgi:hypothetical protein
MNDDAYARYVRINLPHARTIVGRIGRSLEALGAFSEEATRDAFRLLDERLQDFDEDPPFEQALDAADAAAEDGRGLVEALLATRIRGDRLGQHVRNLFECLGLAEEGATLSLECGERPDSPLR